jgi:SnoaL-like polyketide cyclase
MKTNCKSNTNMECVRSSRNDRQKKCETTIVSNQSVECVQGYMDAINRHADLDALLSFYTSNQVKIVFEDGLTVTAQTSCELYQSLYACFPDIQRAYASLAVPRANKPNVVLVDETTASGTHTGAPFGFKHRPKIPPTGRRFENDPARLFFTVVDGKIDRIEVVAIGSRTGPLGIYEAIGGVVD